MAHGCDICILLVWVQVMQEGIALLTKNAVWMAYEMFMCVGGSSAR
jgi:hypothetical protein